MLVVKENVGDTAYRIWWGRGCPSSKKLQRMPL